MRARAVRGWVAAHRVGTLGGRRGTVRRPLLCPSPPRPTQTERPLLVGYGHRQHQPTHVRHGERDHAGIIAPFSAASSCRAVARTTTMPPRGYPGVREQTERHEAVPCRPCAHLVLIYADLAFCLREAFFDLPAGIAYPYQLLLRGLFRAGCKPVHMLTRNVRVAADEQPAAHPLRALRGQHEACPIAAFHSG